MNEPDLGPLRERFEINPDDERALARLRMVAAALAALASIAMLLSRLPFVMVMLATLALLVALGWFSRARKLRARAKQPEQHFLAIHARGFVSGEGQAQTIVPWKEVTHIEVDEERLEIAVKCADGRSVHIEPRFSGVEIHELVHRLRNACQQSNDHGETR